jgi:hypothetical protein
MEEVIYIKSVLEVEVKILRVGLEYIYQKHIDLKNDFQAVVDCLRFTDEVWLSKQDPKVHLYYKKINQKYICVVCKHYNSDAFLITAYYTYKLQGKERVWLK